MTGCILDINTHYRIFSAHSLRSKADCIDSVFQKLLHFCCICIVIVRTDRTHKCFLGVEGCCLYRCSYTYTHKKRRTSIQSVSCHLIKNKIGNAFISCTWHKYHCFSRKSTSASCHVCVNLTFITVWNDVPPYSRSSFSNVFLGVVLVKSFYRVMS